MKKYRKILLISFLILLPWQTRLIFEELEIFKSVSEYGKLSIYAFDILLILFILTSISVLTKKLPKIYKESKSSKYLIIATAAIALLTILSSSWAPQNHAAIVSAAHITLAAILMLIIIADDKITPEIILGGITIGMLIPALLAWVQTASQSVPPSTILGISAHNPETLGTAVIQTTQERWLRAYATFPHPNIMGGFTAIGLISAFALAIRRKTKSLEPIIAISAALMGGALVMTASRAAMTAFVIATAWILLALKSTHKKQKIKEARGVIALSLTTMLLIGIFMSPILSARLDTENKLEKQSITERTEQLTDVKALSIATTKSSLIGYGAGNYVFALSQIHPLQKAYAYQPAHFIAGIILVELGLLGIIITLIIAVAASIEANRTWYETNSIIAIALLIALAVISLADHYLWTNISGLYLLAISLATIKKLPSVK